MYKIRRYNNKDVRYEMTVRAMQILLINTQ